MKRLNQADKLWDFLCLKHCYINVMRYFVAQLGQCSEADMNRPRAQI